MKTKRERDVISRCDREKETCLDVGRVNRTSDGFHSREERRTLYASANEKTNESGAGAVLGAMVDVSETREPMFK